MAFSFVTPPQLNKSQAGFTLIELIIVISIIAVLVVLGVGVYTLGIDRAKNAKAQGDINRIVTAIRQLDLDTGYVPNKESGSNCSAAGGLNLTGDDEIFFAPGHGSMPASGLFANFSVPVPNWKGPYLDGTINELSLDPWGKPYIFDGTYTCVAGIKGCERYLAGTLNDRVVTSSGKDKVQYTSDDLVYVFCGV